MAARLASWSPRCAFQRIRTLIVVGLIQLTASVGCGGGAGSPTSPSPTPTASPSERSYVIRGVVGEYGSANLNETLPIVGVTVTVVDGTSAGKSAMTDSSGQYVMSAVLPGTFAIRASREGYQAQERQVQVAADLVANFVMIPTCESWPVELSSMMARLPLPDGLCLVRRPSAQPSNYVAVQRVVYYRSPSPGTDNGGRGGEIGAIAHEICHAHQHRAILDSGRPEPKHDGEMVPWWTETPAGRGFVEVTGWRLQNPGGPAPSFGWVEQCESWGCGYANPLEDSAETCAFWYNATNDSRRGPQRLSQAAPRRAQWARQWLP